MTYNHPIKPKVEAWILFRREIVIRDILSSGELALSSPAVDVDGDVSKLISDMWETMYANKGVGLAANQIGVLQRVIVVHVKGFKQSFVNPVIIKRYGGTTMNKEGCLSRPGASVKVSRYHRVIVQETDSNGNKFSRKLKGLAAYCVQHEVDHLNGIIIGEPQ